MQIKNAPQAARQDDAAPAAPSTPLHPTAHSTAPSTTEAPAATAAPAQAQPTRTRLPQYCLLGGFLALLLLPYPLWWCLQGYCDTTNYENRTLASCPDLATTSLSALPAAIESWIEDSAPFRNQLMRLNATLNWALNTLDSGDVLLGKENWLFLRDVADSSSISDYQGLTYYTEAEQAELLAAIETLSDALAAYDCDLVVLFAPAKEGVYAQYMPDEIVVMGETRVEALVSYLTLHTAQAANTSIVWPKETLQTLATTQAVYYQYDTHWNEVGGWVASQSVLASLGLSYQTELPAVYIDESATAPSDLADVSAAWAICDDDLYYALDTPQADCITIAQSGNVTQWAGSGTLDLLMIRDSFGEAMDSYLAECFASSTVVHGNSLNEATLREFVVDMPDVLVIEVGERYSDNLLARVESMIALLPTLAG